MAQAMYEVVLDRSELLVLLDATGASAVVGLDAERLLPASDERYAELVEQGQRLLAERGLLRFGAGNERELDPLLAAMAAVLARPEVALVSVRDTPGVGRQLFLHYQRGAYVVEQSLPAEGQHRLATLPSRAALLDRLLVIFPVPDGPAAQDACDLPQAEFFAAREHAAQGREDAAALVLRRHGLAPDAAAELAQAMADPVFSGTIALLRCVDEEVVAARNPAIVQGRGGAWLIAQTAPGEERLRAARTDRPRLRAQLAAWHEELLGAAAGR